MLTILSPKEVLTDSQITAKKKFDCVEFKRKAQMEIFEETRGMTPQQEIAYFNKKAEVGRVGNWWKKVRKTFPAIEARPGMPVTERWIDPSASTLLLRYV